MSDSATKSRPNSLYERDFFTWTQEQARLLRERRFGDLDLDNLVDEVESVGSSEKHEIRRRLKVLLTHLLKWKFQPGLRGVSWRRTIRQQREAIAEIIETSPSLRAYPSQVMRTAYTGATVSASEETGIIIGIFPETCPFSVDQILDLEFFPEDPANE
jgi:Domain of unknown function DUF29